MYNDLNNSKKYLSYSDVPVLLIGFNRPEFIKARVNELSHMPIEKLYISIDGGDHENYNEMLEALSWSKEKLKHLDFLQIYTHEENLGLVSHITSSITTMLKKHSHLVIVEDDVALGRNFFINMVKGFNHQITTGNKGIIGGFSAINCSNYGIFENKWRKSKYCVIWGWGCSAEIWRDYNSRLDENKFEKDLTRSKTWANLSNFQQQVWKGRFRKTIINPNFTWDIQLQYLSFSNDFVNFYPISSLTRNLGYSDERSSNTKNTKPRWMTLTKPDDRIVSTKSIFYLTKKFFEIFDANFFMSDTKFIHWWNHKKHRFNFFKTSLKGLILD